LAVATLFSTRVLAQNAAHDPTLAVHHGAVEDMTSQLTTKAQSMPDKRKDKLLDLVKKQKEQLEAVEKSTRQIRILCQKSN
jgi:hypothetical protein